MDSDDEVQEIDPPVIMRSEHKKYCRRIMQEEIFVVVAKESTKMWGNTKIKIALILLMPFLQHKHHKMQI
jgi:hypothetical protein